MKCRRREFLAAVAATTVACGGRPSPWRFLTSDEALTLEAVCERIVPSDRDAGAKQAGVVSYIDRQLSGFYAKHRDAYRDGLARIDAVSVQSHRARFAHLTPDQQDSVLQSLENEHAPFFDLLLSHTMQGYYGSPRHGGNRDALSWKMLGVPYPPVRGRV